MQVALASRIRKTYLLAKVVLLLAMMMSLWTGVTLIIIMVIHMVPYVGEVGSGTYMPGTKMRMSEYQAAIGLAQIEKT